MQNKEIKTSEYTTKEMKHFSHSHPLELSDVPEGKEVICSCCEESLTAGEEAYLCTKSKCKFSLHKPCSEFPKKMKHKSDPKHKLILHSKPPSDFSSENYACNACENKFSAFIYHCEDCYLYIHPKCAFVPETVRREDHQHPLKLYYSSPYEDYFATFCCDVCEEVALRSAWVYYCSECDYGTHFGCVNAEPVQKESSEEEEEEQEEEESVASSEEEEEEETVASENDKDKLAIWGVEDEDGETQKDENEDGDGEAEEDEDEDGETEKDENEDGDGEAQEDEEKQGEKGIRSDDGENSKPHFSHHHDLVRLILDEGEELKCSGCNARNKESFHGCLSCEFYLHESCLKTPRFLHHPYHPNHALTLLPAPTYPSRSFICDACGFPGKSFCFSCTQCDCDLHLQCAALPQQLTDPEKHDHVLTLAFGSPAAGNCNVCEKQVGAKQWVYNCKSCDYDAHLSCVDSGYIEPVEETEDEGGDGDGKPGDAVEAINQSMANMNALTIANIQAMDQMARLQFQTNMAQMNARAVANMFRW